MMNPERFTALSTPWGRRSSDILAFSSCMRFSIWRTGGEVSFRRWLTMIGLENASLRSRNRTSSRSAF